MEKLHTLNNLMPKQVADVKNMCVKGVDALAAFASGVHGVSGADTSATVPSALKLSELEVAFVTDAIPDKYRDKFAPFFEYLGSPVKDRKAYDFSAFASDTDVVDSRGNRVPVDTRSDEEKRAGVEAVGAPEPVDDRSSLAVARREKNDGPDMRLVAIEAIGRLRGTFLGLCG